jgi:hypothetical protein
MWVTVLAGFGTGHGGLWNAGGFCLHYWAVVLLVDIRNFWGLVKAIIFTI